MSKQNTPSLPHIIISVKELCRRANMSRSSAYERMKSDPDFPRKIHIGIKSIGFLEADVNAWIESRIKASRSESSNGGNHA